MPRRRHNHPQGVPHLVRRRGRNKLWTGWLNGKEVSLGTSDAAEAEQRLQQLAAEERRRTESGPAPAQQDIKLSEAAFLFAESCRPPRHTPKTAARYGLQAAHFVEWAEARKVTMLSQVTPVILVEYIQSKGKSGVGGATVNRSLSLLSSFLKFAELNGLLSESPLSERLRKKLRMKEPKPRPNSITLSTPQIELFLAEAERGSLPAYAALFRLTAGTGMRIDEARHLEPQDIDEQKGCVTITPKKGWTTKGYRYRTVPASSATLEAARRFIDLREGVALDDKSVWVEIRRILKRTQGVPEFSIHELRRAWASAVYARGATLKQVSVWLGHSGVQVTERYIRLVETKDGRLYLPL